MNGRFIRRVVGAILGCALALGIGISLSIDNRINAVHAETTTHEDDIYTFSKSSTPSGWTINSTNTHANNYLKLSPNDNLQASASALFKNDSFLSTNMKVEVSCGTFGTWQNPKSVVITAEFRKSNNDVLTTASVTPTGLNSSESTYRTAISLSKPSDPTQIAYLRITFSNFNQTSETLRVKNVRLNYSEAPISSDPSVSITNSGSSSRMLNKSGDPITVNDISASAQNLGATPYYVWSITNNDSCDAALTDDDKLHTATPTITASHAGNFDLSVTAYNEEDGSEYATVPSATNIVIKEYGGSISWTSRSALTFKEGIGFDYSTATFTTTMNDGTIINKSDYAGDYSDLHLYVGDDEVDNGSVDQTYCSVSRSYKMYDSEHNAWSNANPTTLTYSAKAGVVVSSIGGISEIEPAQVLYLKTEIGSGWGNSIQSIESDNTSVATVAQVSENTKYKVTGVAVGSATITVTLTNGETSSFNITISSKVTFTPEQLNAMLTENGLNSATYNQYRYHNLAKSAVSVYYRTSGYYKNDYIYQDSAMASDNRVQLYGTATNNTGKSLAQGCIAEIKSLGFMYYGSGAEFNTYTVESITAPSVENFDITGEEEVYKGENLQLGTANFVPDGATQTVTWTASSGATITSEGVFSAANSGVYTVTATSTTPSAKAVTKNIHVYEYKETALTLKNDPKTTYYVGQRVEEGLISASVSYKCGEDDYVPTSLPAIAVSGSWTYDGAVLAGNLFSNAHAAATLGVTSASVTITLPNESQKVFNVDTDLSISNVAVYAVELDLANTVITPAKTAFKFGEDFSQAGSITVKYLNNYPDRVVDLASATIEEYNMRKLGSQSVKVYINDSAHSGVSKALVGTYTIDVTNVGSSSTESSSLDIITSETSNLSDGSERVTTLESAMLNVTQVIIDFKLKVPTTSGGPYSHSITYKLYDSSDNVVDSYTKTVSCSANSTNNDFSYTFNLNSASTIAKISFTWTKPTGSNARCTKFSAQFVSAKANFVNDQAAAFATFFLEQTDGYCTSSLSEEVKTSLWTQYDAMHDDAKTAFTSATIVRGKNQSYDNELSEAFSRYLNMIEEERETNFLGLSNNALNGAQKNNASWFASDSNHSLATIIVISSAALTATGGFFLLRRRKEN